MTIEKVVQKLKKRLVSKWKKNGPYENFGQKEVRKLWDDFVDLGDYSEEGKKNREAVLEFENWSADYTG